MGKSALLGGHSGFPIQRSVISPVCPGLPKGLLLLGYSQNTLDRMCLSQMPEPTELPPFDVQV